MKMKDVMRKDVVTNAGADVDGIQKIASNSKEDMAAFDQFGPKSRAVLNTGMPIKWSSHQTLQAVQQMGMNPQNPHHDEMIANQLRQHAGMVSRKLRTEELETYVPDMMQVLREYSELFELTGKGKLPEIQDKLEKASKKAEKKAWSKNGTPADLTADAEINSRKLQAGYLSDVLRARSETPAAALEKARNIRMKQRLRTEKPDTTTPEGWMRKKYLEKLSIKKTD